VTILDSTFLGEDRVREGADIKKRNVERYHDYNRGRAEFSFHQRSGTWGDRRYISPHKPRKKGIGEVNHRDTPAAGES